MKLILIIVILGAGVWFLMTKAKENAAVKQMTQAPEQYTKSLQNDVKRADEAAAKASKLINEQNKEVQKTVEAQ